MNVSVLMLTVRFPSVSLTRLRRRTRAVSQPNRRSFESATPWSSCSPQGYWKEPPGLWHAVRENRLDSTTLKTTQKIILPSNYQNETTLSNKNPKLST